MRHSAQYKHNQAILTFYFNIQEFDFTLPKTTEPIPPIRRKIENQYQSLKNLIHFNNGIFQKEKESIKNSQEAEVAEFYKQHEGEDEKFLIAKETEIANKYIWEDEVLFYTANDFYQASLIMAFSYFESLVATICYAAKGCNKGSYVGDNLQILMDTYKITLSDEKKVEYITGNLKKVRNFLTHNYNIIIVEEEKPTQQSEQKNNNNENNKDNKNQSKEKNKDESRFIEQLQALKEESNRNIGLKFLTNDKLDKSAIAVILNSEYVEQALDKMYDILVELADKLDLK